MNWNKKMLGKMILTYIIVWIPLILLNLFQTNANNQKIVQQAQEEIQNRLVQTAEDFSIILSKYESNSITMSNSKYLSARNMLSDMNSVREGLDFLKYGVAYDFYSHDVFIYYNTDVAYSIKGYTRLKVYLSSYLKLNAPDEAAAMLAEKADRIAAFWNGNESGYILVHCYNGNQSSVNYVLPFSGMKNILSRLASINIDYIELQFSNGESIHYVCHDGIRLVSVSESQTLEKNRFDQMDISFGADPITLRIYYQDTELYSDAHHFQRLNTLLMALGAILSIGAAYFLSRRQLKRIKRLEETISTAMISPDTKLQLPRRWDEYSGVRAAVRQAQEKYSDLSDSQQLYQALLRQQTLKLLLHHLFIDQKELAHMLESANAALNEEYFCLGAVIYPQDTEVPRGLWRLFDGGLCCEELLGNHRIFCFLMELPHIDSVSALRSEMAQRLQDEKMIAQDTEILFSLVFQDLGQAHYAWQEMEKRICKGNTAEENPRSISTADYPLNDLRRPFLAAFEKRIYQEARNLLDSFCQRVDILPGSAAEKNALRYDLLNQMMAVVHNRLPEKEEKIQAQLEKINYQDGKEFHHQLRALLQNMGEQTGSDAFVKAVEFIQANYQDCNMSADQVAKYGGFNKTYLSRLFKAHTNQSYIEYLTQVRMEKARDLLLNTNLGVHEIVLKIGYLDDSSFRKKFKSIYGMSTSEFRQQYRGESIPDDE